MVKKKEKEERVGNYFLKEKELKFISSGCQILDCVLGGGYPLGRIVNIVGDKAVGKTLLAIEAFANFNMCYPEGKMYYHETEAAFDTDYAEALGMPVEKVEFPEDDTVEGFFEILSDVIEKHKESGVPGIYVLDSLDALSDRAEKERKIDEGSYAMNKQKKLSEIFRRLASEIEETNICLMVVSQVREAINVAFGDKYKRSGGKALDFYASQALWLAQREMITKTVKGIKRATGIVVKAKCKKNKVGLPYRECEFPIIFMYGINAVEANLWFLKDVKGALEEIGIENTLDSYLASYAADVIRNKDFETMAKIAEQVKKVWSETEKSFMPEVRKYQ